MVPARNVALANTANAAEDHPMTDDRTSPAFVDDEVVDLHLRRRPSHGDAQHQGAPDQRRHLDMWLKFEVDSTPLPDATGSNEQTKLLFRSDETLAEALQRSSLEQFDIAITPLSDPNFDRDKAVHTARKAMKRIRALLRFVRDYIGRDIYRAENVLIRDASRSLSGARTAAVMMRALDHLSAHFQPSVDPALFSGLAESLRITHGEISHAVTDNSLLINEVLVALEAGRARFASWPISEATTSRSSLITRTVVPDKFSSLEPGIRRVYGRGQDRMALALDRPSEEAFHEWRKRVKYLRYQMEALRAVWPSVVGGLESSLNDLAETLGEEHDLAELAGYAITNRNSCTEAERRMLVAIASQRRRELQIEAATIGHRVYAEPPKVFTRRLGAYWDAWHERANRSNSLSD